MVKNFTRHRVARFLAALVLTGGATLGAAPANAATTQAAPVYEQTVQFTMSVDCTTMTDESRAYAAEHDIKVCAGGIAARNEVSNVCGSSQVTIGRAGGGNAFITWGFSSALGNMVYRSLVVDWSGDAASDTIPDASFMNAASYGNAAVAPTGSGPAGAALYGTATLAWGPTCYMDGPTSSTVIP